MAISSQLLCDDLSYPAGVRHRANVLSQRVEAADDFLPDDVALEIERLHDLAANSSSIQSQAPKRLRR